MCVAHVSMCPRPAFEQKSGTSNLSCIFAVTTTRRQGRKWRQYRYFSQVETRMKGCIPKVSTCWGEITVPVEDSPQALANLAGTCPLLFLLRRYGPQAETVGCKRLSLHPRFVRLPSPLSTHYSLAKAESPWSPWLAPGSQGPMQVRLHLKHIAHSHGLSLRDSAPRSLLAPTVTEA